MKLLIFFLGTLQAYDYSNSDYNSYENYETRPSRRPTSAPSTDEIPDYGPITGFTRCLSPGDRVYDNYSMLKEISGNHNAKGAENYAIRYCKERYKNQCDIIVKIIRNDEYEGLRMTIQLGSYKTPQCQPYQNDPTITRTIIWNRETRIIPTPSPKSQLSYGPIYGTGHKCQLEPQHNKYALNHQFSTFEEAARFCKARMPICGILVELTLEGQDDKERKIYETGSTTQSSCHCPQQNTRPFKKVVAIWEDKKVSKPPCLDNSPPPTVMPPIGLAWYGPVFGQCVDQPILGDYYSPTFLQTVNWKNDPMRAFHNCRNSVDYFQSECDLIVKYTYKGNDYYEIGKSAGSKSDDCSDDTRDKTKPCHCSPANLKESAENKQKSIKITVVHKNGFQ